MAAALHYLPEEADADLVEAFIVESSDLLVNSEEALLALESDPGDMDAVSTVFRAFHTIKGTSSFLELDLVSDLAHRAETLLSRVRDGEIRFTGGYADLALRSLDALKDLIGAVQGALDGSPYTTPPGYDELQTLLADPEAAGISESQASPGPAAAEEPPAPEEPATPEEPTEPEAEPEKPEKPEEPAEESGFPPAPEPASPPEPFPRKEAAEPARQQAKAEPSRVIKESSVRVPVERLDRFIDMVGELVVAHSMVVQDETVAAGGHHELTKKVGQTTKIVRELQRMSMSMRMIPLKGTFQKMARLVRDLARKAGKNVSFLTEGEETEIDRNMVDIINDPLVHMIRNAVDHGIESPGDRERTGKPVNGIVQLSAYHSAGNVVVEIRDDGRGLDREAILSKALERGLITTIDGLSDEEVYGLIFQPGFSTASTVSEVSGRGVGMDVVKTNIESLRGQVEVKSWPGQGSVVKMSLPLTLAIIDGMVIRVGTQKFVIPTVSIVRSVQPVETDLSRVFQRGEMLSLQGKLIPLFRLATLFEIEDAATDPTQAIVVVVEDDRRQTGLLVDELIGSQQIVIKTLGEALGDIPGVSGSAIMPNGRVGLILDVGGLVRLASDFNPEKQAPDEFSQSDVSGADRETV
jgi:two-component system chemotaxis sensor kinase CheA